MLKAFRCRSRSVKKAAIKFARAAKFLVDLCVPVALVFYAVQADRTQHLQTDIARDQARIADRQATIEDAQNLAAFSFRRVAAEEPGHAPGTIVVSNTGAPFNDVRIWAFSYLEAEGWQDKNAAEPVKLPFLATDARLSYEGRSTGDVASFARPIGDRFTSELQRFARDPDRRPPMLSNVSGPLTIVEIAYSDRGGTRHRQFFGLDGDVNGWTVMLPEAAMEAWMTSSLDRFGFDEDAGFQEPSSGQLTPYQRQQIASDVADVGRELGKRLGCSFYAGKQRRQWQAQLHHRVEAASFPNDGRTAVSGAVQEDATSGRSFSRGPELLGMVLMRDPCDPIVVTALPGR